MGLILLLLCLYFVLFFTIRRTTWFKNYQARRLAKGGPSEVVIGGRYEVVINDAIAKHAGTLLIKREQLTVVDEYGNTDYSRFFEHINYFIVNVIARDLKAQGLSPKLLSHVLNERRMKTLMNKIALAVVAEAEKHRSLNFDEVHTGVEYELFCKRILEANGWDVLTTPATGDQGADLIATKPPHRVVFQCKLYSQPVGNKAVQEAYAAKAFQHANFAVVVSNASYTSSAKQLAQSNGVFLVHHQSLPLIEGALGTTSFVQDGTET